MQRVQLNMCCYTRRVENARWLDTVTLTTLETSTHDDLHATTYLALYKGKSPRVKRDNILCLINYISWVQISGNNYSREYMAIMVNRLLILANWLCGATTPQLSVSYTLCFIQGTSMYRYIPILLRRVEIEETMNEEQIVYILMKGLNLSKFEGS